MQHRFFDLIDQTYDFPQEGFSVPKDELFFHNIPIMNLIKEFGTPLKLTYLPNISTQINRVKGWFADAIEKHNYKGKYRYSYCTKSNHFSYVMREAFNNDIHLELSSAFDVEIAYRLLREGLVTKKTYILCNGFKTPPYLAAILKLHEDGFTNVIPILDTVNELDAYEAMDFPIFNIGIRIATEEQPGFDLYTSRFGIRYAQIMGFFRERIQDNEKINLSMLHFFVYTGIRDTTYYWNEFNKCLRLFCDLKRLCPQMNKLNIGGGFPTRSSLGDQFDYSYMIAEIVRQIKEACDEQHVYTPDIFTEFGSFTVAESSANILKVLDTKRQNDREAWYVVDSSFMTTLPDTWGLHKKFILLPINKWHTEYQRVILGGLTCDNDDYYDDDGQVLLPYYDMYEDEEPLYVGFFQTGAYQDSVSGFGGVHHCLIPQPKHVLVADDPNGGFTYKVFSEEQSLESVMKLLGY